MSEDVGPRTSPRGGVRSFIIVWTIVAALLAAALVSAVGALNRDVYGPRGLVSAYLDALAYRDAAAALALPGVAPSARDLRAAGLPATASRELLRDSVLEGIHDVSIAGDRDLGGDRHRVTARYRLGPSGQTPLRTAAFTLERTGSYLGVFSTWAFARTPLAVAVVTVEHAHSFTVAGLRRGLSVDPRATDPTQPSAFSATADYLVLAPGRYAFDHSSQLLDAETATIAVEPGKAGHVTVDARPTATFTKRVQDQLDGFLDDCADQEVLKPSGCPFGTDIENRLEDAPRWSIADYPKVELRPGRSAWTTTPAAGTAHLTVSVQSIFDGSVSELDKDVPFTTSLTVRIAADGSLHITVSG